MPQVAGWVSQLILWPLAAIGLVTVMLATVAAMNYAPQGVGDLASGEGIQSDESLRAGSAQIVLDERRQNIFDRSCAICHSQPGTGAPRSGDNAAWQPRVALGIDTLLERTLKGYNAMPPMGMCMDCSEGDFIALIEYMGQFDSGLECD